MVRAYINIAIQLYLSLITNYHKRQEHICYIRNTANTLQHSAKTETIDNIAYEIIHRKLNRFPYRDRSLFGNLVKATLICFGPNFGFVSLSETKHVSSDTLF